eukprot:scaffold1868_cov193-Cylindrotheca_fusiformis.AAC.7
MKRQAPSSNDDTPRRKQHIRLLLHAVDGCVPYLTPSTLERYFPGNSDDDLWIGLAVQDTCIAPVFFQEPESEQTKDDNDAQSPNKNKKKKRGKQSNSKKPTGYTFAPVDPDPWLLPYTRVTVPLFPVGRGNGTDDDKQGASVSCTNTHLAVWTPHGRQKLTPELYAAASIKLQSQYTLSLYDSGGDGDGRNIKRQEKAQQRNRDWFQDLCNRRDSKPETLLWSPVLLPNSSSSSNDIDSSLNLPSNLDSISGIALIGTWRKDFEKSLESLNSSVDTVAILSTHTISEILEVSCSQKINVVGSDLPTRWAKKKHALAVPLAILEETSSKRAKQEDGEVSSILNQDGCMDLNDTKYARDSGPLVEGCTCLACANGDFSRSYIHHLVVARELLAEILLFGHNLHHLLSLLRSFSAAQDPEALKVYISKQLSSS